MKAIILALTKPRLFRAALFLFLIYGTAYAQYGVESMSFTETSAPGKTNQYAINLFYPHLKYPDGALMGVRGMINDANMAIDTFALQRVNSFKDEVKSLTQKGLTGKSTLDSKYMMVMNTNALISIKHNVSEYIDGSAHPMNYVDCLNYSFNSEGVFTIKDMFLDKSNYLKYISDYCVSELKKAANGGGFDSDIEKGASADLKNFATFNVNYNFLEIVFNYYQVGPRPFGIQTVTIDMNNMKDMINPDGPVGVLVKNE